MYVICDNLMSIDLPPPASSCQMDDPLLMVTFFSYVATSSESSEYSVQKKKQWCDS